MTMERDIIIIGAGGHAKVVVDTLDCMGLRAQGVVDAQVQGVFMGLSVLGDDSYIFSRETGGVLLVNGLGSVTAGGGVRRRIFEDCKSRGYSFLTLIHPSAIVAKSVELGEGAQIMAGAVVQPGCRLGKNVVVNTGVVLDHDGYVADHCHIAPGCAISGGVDLGVGVHVGVGATIIEGIRIGAETMVAAGAVVVGDVMSGTRVAGTPAKEMSEKEQVI